MRDFTEKILVDLRNEATRPLPVCRRRKQAVLYIISRENDGVAQFGGMEPPFFLTRIATIYSFYVDCRECGYKASGVLTK